MGGGGSSSTSDSIGESIARQALFYPSSDAIQASMDKLRGYTDQANAQLQPFTQSAVDALNDMRFWQGMAPIDPAGKQAESLRGLATALRAPAAAWVDPVSGKFLKDKSNFVSPNAPGYNTIQDYYAGRSFQSSMNPAVSDGYNRTSPGQPPRDAWGNVMPAVAKTPAFGSLSYSNIGNYPETWDPKYGVGGPGYNPAGIAGGDLYRYTIDSQTNTDSLTMPLTDAVNALTALSTATDPDQRQKLYDQAMAGFDKFNYQTEVILSGSFGQPEQASLRQDWEYINKLKAEVQGTFKQAGPRAPTGEEVYKRLSETPGYQSRLTQGLNNIENTQIAKGLFGSGRAAKELTRYGQEYASRELENQFQRSAQIAGVSTPALQQSSQNTQSLAQPMAQATQDMDRQWNMSPWTQRSYQMSHSESKSSEGAGGIGQIAGTLLGGLFG